MFLLWTANFAVSQLFPWMLSTFEYRVFWFFGALCVLTIGFVWLLVPETKGRSLEELEYLSH